MSVTEASEYVIGCMRQVATQRWQPNERSQLPRPRPPPCSDMRAGVACGHSSSVTTVAQGVMTVSTVTIAAAELTGCPRRCRRDSATQLIITVAVVALRSPQRLRRRSRLHRNLLLAKDQ